MDAIIELETAMSPIEEIPDDPVLLREFARRLQAELRSQKERAELYQREYEKLAREAFGRRSERVDGQDEGQLILFDQPAPEGEARAATSAPSRRFRSSRASRTCSNVACSCSST